MTSILILLSSMAIPLAIVMAVMFAIEWLRARDKRRSPLSGRAFHQPGEALRQRIASLTGNIEEKLLRVLFIGPLLLLAALLPRVNWSAMRLGWVEGCLAVAAALFIAWNLRGAVRDGARRQRARQGLAGELMTAQQLLPLMAQGCQVYHDIPAGKFNLDHVVIGPSAVFVVETKSRRKPPGKGKDKATVVYDGSCLRFPDHVDKQIVEQARGEARWLAEHLRGTAGEPVPVVAVVALPGWFVSPGKDAHRSDVRVINPKMHGVFVDRRGAPISDSLRNRVAHALTQCYPDVDA